MKKQAVYSLILFALAALAGACKTSKAAPKPAPDQAAFYTIHFSIDSLSKKTKAELSGIKIVEAKVKFDGDKDQAQNPNHLYIEINGAKNNSVALYAPHPLYKKVDAYGDSGKIESKLVYLRQADLFFRAPYHKDHKTIKITETIDNKPGSTILLKHEK